MRSLRKSSAKCRQRIRVTLYLARRSIINRSCSTSPSAVWLSSTSAARLRRAASAAWIRWPSPSARLWRAPSTGIRRSTSARVRRTAGTARVSARSTAGSLFALVVNLVARLRTCRVNTGLPHLSNIHHNNSNTFNRHHLRSATMPTPPFPDWTLPGRWKAFAKR